MDKLILETKNLTKTFGQIFFEGHEWSRDDLSDIGSLIECLPCMRTYQLGKI